MTLILNSGMGPSFDVISSLMNKMSELIKHLHKVNTSQNKASLMFIIFFTLVNLFT